MLTYQGCPQTPGGRIRALGFARMGARGRRRGPLKLPSDAGRAHPRPLESTHWGPASLWTRGRGRGPRTGDVSVSGLAGMTLRPSRIIVGNPGTIRENMFTQNRIRVNIHSLGWMLRPPPIDPPQPIESVLMRGLLWAFALVLALAIPGAARADVAGAYHYTGTETDGSAENPGVVKVTPEPSGAYSVVWDGGDYVGVGQVIANVFAIAAVADGKNTIMLLTINPDGSLSGPWWRRKDPGSKGSESWTR